MTDPIYDTRKLTIEEVYQCLYKDWKKALFKIGQLESEVDELTFLKEELEKKLSELKKPDKETKVERKQSEYIQGLLEKIKRLEDQNVRLRQGNGELISKLIANEKRLEKQT